MNDSDNQPPRSPGRPRLPNPLEQAAPAPEAAVEQPREASESAPPLPAAPQPRHTFRLRTMMIAMVVLSIAVAGYASSKSGQAEREIVMLLFLGLLPVLTLLGLVAVQLIRSGIQKPKFSIRFMMLVTLIVAVATAGYSGMNVGGSRRIGAMLFTLVTPVVLVTLFGIGEWLLRKRR